jgi:hypothetical protein
MDDDRRATIGNNRITAYFEGKVEGLDKDHHIYNNNYLKLGDLNIDESGNGEPYQF